MEFSKAGLEEFARYWYSTLGYAYETGDSKPMLAISSASCNTCSRVATSLDELYGKGGWVMGGLMTVLSSQSTFHKTPDENYQAIVMYQQSKVTSYNSDKSIDADHPPTIARPDIVVATYANGKWTAETAEHLTKE